MTSPGSQHQRSSLPRVSGVDLRPLGYEEPRGVDEVCGRGDVERSVAVRVRRVEADGVRYQQLAALLVASHQGAVQGGEAGDVWVNNWAAFCL